MTRWSPSSPAAEAPGHWGNLRRGGVLGMTTTRIPAPAVLDATESPRWIRRGSQAEVLAALRKLLAPPVVEDPRRRGPSLGTRLAALVARERWAWLR